MEFWDDIINNFEEEHSPQPIIGGKTGKPPEFKELPNHVSRDIRVAFVDGGNCTLFSAPNFLLAKVRVGVAIFSGRTKISETKKDYDLKCYFENGWVADFNGEIYRFETKDLIDGGRENIDRIPQILRRILEVRTAASLEKENDFVVLDGTLDGTFESEELKKLGDKVLGLSKTNTIRTVKGNSYTALLAKLGPETFVCDEVLPRISFLKLGKSPYVFRLDGLLTEELLSLFVEHAKDPAIIGYPYGLLVADRVARIPDYEARTLKIKAFAELGKKSESIRKLLAGRDIHDFLDGQNIY